MAALMGNRNKHYTELQGWRSRGQSGAAAFQRTSARGTCGDAEQLATRHWCSRRRRYSSGPSPGNVNKDEAELWARGDGNGRAGKLELQMGEEST